MPLSISRVFRRLPLARVLSPRLRRGARAFGFASLIAAFVQAAPAHAAKRFALLVGVSGYTTEGVPPLKGTPNDVRLMWTTLQRELGYTAEDIIVLADNLERGADWPVAKDLPVKAAILAEIRRLRANAAAEDRVILYFAGHGTTIADDNDDEDDGLDEVFLPLDIKKFDEEKGVLPNALIDDEIEAELKGFKARVWAIFDTCHSGDITRGPANTMATRSVDPKALGMPLAFSQPKVSANRPATRSGQIVYDSRHWLPKDSDRGSIVAFSAVGPQFKAIEREIQDRGGRVHGVFTHLLAEAIARQRPATYADLMGRLDAAYAAFDPSMPRPSFEGNLDAPIGGEHRPWTVTAQGNDFVIGAGLLQGLRVGSVLVLAPSREAEPIGFVEVLAVQAITSVAKPVRYRDVAAPQARSGQGALIAVPVDVVSFKLRVARPKPVSGRSEPWMERARAAIAEVETRARRDGGMPLEWDDNDGDVFLVLNDGAIRVLPSVGAAPRLGTRPQPVAKIGADVAATANSLEEALGKLLRQRNILDVAAKLVPPAFAKDLDVKVTLDSSDRKSETQACASGRVTESGTAHTVDPRADLRLTHCDRIHVAIHNKSTVALDITCLYLDADGGIVKIQDGVADTSCAARARIGAGLDRKASQIPIVTKCNKAQPECQGSDAYMATGIERLMIIAVARPSPSDRPITFWHLEQQGLDRTVPVAMAMRSGTQLTPLEAFDALLRDAARGGTRSGHDLGVKEVYMKTFSWTVEPPQGSLLPR